MGILACPYDWPTSGGEQRLFLQGANVAVLGASAGDPIYEIAVPDTLSFDHTLPTRARFVRNWGPAYSARPTYNNPGGAQSWGQGLLWDDAIKGIWWSYGDSYDAGGRHDPSLGAAVLNDSTGALTPYGPWRTQAISQRTRSYMTRIPDWFASQYCGGNVLGLGAQFSSAGASSPWGPALFAAPRVSLATPPDVVTVTTPVVSGPGATGPHWSVGCRTAVLFDMAHRLPREANYLRCGWYNAAGERCGPEEGGGGPDYTDAHGHWQDLGLPYFLQNDYINSMAWIDLPDKHGLVYFGNMAWPTTTDAQPHVWYGTNMKPSADLNHWKCCPHDKMDIYHESTGPGTSGQRPFWWIFDPADIGQVLQGRKNPWEIPVSSRVSIYEQFAPKLSHFDFVWMWHFTGGHFEPSTRRLYLSVFQGDKVAFPYEPCPMIYVFEVV